MEDHFPRMNRSSSEIAILEVADDVLVYTELVSEMVVGARGRLADAQPSQVAEGLELHIGQRVGVHVDLGPVAFAGEDTGRLTGDGGDQQRVAIADPSEGAAGGAELGTDVREAFPKDDALLDLDALDLAEAEVHRGALRVGGRGDDTRPLRRVGWL